MVFTTDLTICTCFFLLHDNYFISVIINSFKKPTRFFRFILVIFFLEIYQNIENQENNEAVNLPTQLTKQTFDYSMENL